jgi:HK97 family phage prohead protease
MILRKDGGRKFRQRDVAFKADVVNEDGTFTGYGSVFGVLDSYREIVARGAFTESLERIKASGNILPALWHHLASQPIGGYDSLSEDERGLYVEGFLLKDDVPQARVAYATMRRKIVTGLSIGYYVEASSFNEKERINTLTKLDLVEVSIVTFPANPEARVDAVKAKLAHGVMPTLREFETVLREQGFSKTQAIEIANRGLKSLLDRGELGGDESGELLESLSGLSVPKFSIEV